MRELKVTNSRPMKFYFENKAAINIAYNLVQHDRTIHVEINGHFIKEKFNVV